MKSTTVILGLGSNVGDRAAYLRAAVRGLSALLTDMRVSGIVESAAVLAPGAPSEWNIPYLNMAVSGKTALLPEQLLSRIKTMEKQLGRKPGERWSPREIDIDILAMEDIEFQSSELTVPHPELFKRDFALVPLAELAPDWDFHGHKVSHIVKEKNFSVTPFRNTKLVGIINVTPDSFSDGGDNLDAKAALASIAKLIADGAEVIDIGAESTRPGAEMVGADLEWPRLARIVPNLPGFAAEFSIDTRHAETARKALDYGVQWVNDVSGFASQEMIDAVKNSDCKLVVMHSLSVPADKNIVLPPSADVIEALLAFARERFAQLEAAGIKRERLIFDPGIGFGKTAKQSQVIIRQAARFRELGVPLYYGHSRKSFLGAGNRDQATLEISRTLINAGVDYLRVHDVAAHRELLETL